MQTIRPYGGEWCKDCASDGGDNCGMCKTTMVRVSGIKRPEYYKSKEVTE